MTITPEQLMRIVKNFSEHMLRETIKWKYI